MAATREVMCSAVSSCAVFTATGFFVASIPVCLDASYQSGVAGCCVVFNLPANSALSGLE